MADSLLDVKLILTWLMIQLGATAGAIGLLVPIREAGALLPQLAIAQWLRGKTQRKKLWSLGSVIQSAAVATMVIAVWLFPSSMAITAILFSLVVFALGRSLCSITYKDVLANTIAKKQRGRVTGLAASLASSLVVMFALLILFQWLSLEISTILQIMSLSVLLWLIAAANFLRLTEDPDAYLSENEDEGDASSPPASGANNTTWMARLYGCLQDKQLVLFIVIRALLTVTAVAPPFIFLLATQIDDSALSTNSSWLAAIATANHSTSLALFILASASASFLSSYFWGRLADHSSKRVLRYAALLAACSMAILALIILYRPEWLVHMVSLPTFLFLIMISYHGVRLGRSIHLVDMASAQVRADYTAISNTIIGLVLVLTSGFGWLNEVIGLPSLLLLFASMCALAFIATFRLKAVQD